MVHDAGRDRSTVAAPRLRGLRLPGSGIDRHDGKSRRDGFGVCLCRGPDRLPNFASGHVLIRTMPRSIRSIHP
jgi:hypothetical protein